MADNGAFFTYDPSVGVVIPDTMEVRERVVQMFRNAFGANFVTDSSTPAGVLVDSLAKMLAEQCGIVAQSANGFNINVAQGRWLDAIGTLLGLPRHTNTYTYVRLGIQTSSDSSPMYDVGQIAVSDGEGNVYFNDEKVAFLSADNPMSVKFRSSEAGEIDYAVSGFSVHDNPLLSVNMSPPFDPKLLSVGMSTETDMQYRNRLLSATARSRGYAESVKNAIMEADGAVKSVAIGVNCRTAYIYQDGIVYPPNSVAICIEGFSNEDAIARAIRASVPFGVSYAPVPGDGQHTFYLDETKPNEPGYIGYWHEAKTMKIYVKGHCTMLNYIGDASTAQAEISKLLKSYFAAAGVGVKVSPSKIGVYLRNGMAGVDISDVAISVESDADGDPVWVSEGSVPIPIFNFLEPELKDFTFSREEA
ncbi:MAG: hypothetical protein MJZ81_07280 [Bacteroidales bacterium]|nr:hypothetical protein [Bacteroidales bacterium]